MSLIHEVSTHVVHGLDIDIKGNGQTGYTVKSGEKGKSYVEAKITFYIVESMEFNEKAVDIGLLCEWQDKQYQYPITKNIQNTTKNVEHIKMFGNEVIKAIRKIDETEGMVMYVGNGIPSFDMLESCNLKMSLLDKDNNIDNHIEAKVKFVKEEVARTKETLNAVLARNSIGI